MENPFTNIINKLIHKTSWKFKRFGEGGIFIRYRRTRKFKKSNNSLFSATKIVVIWYVVMITLPHFSSTNAALNDVERSTFRVEADFWDIASELNDEEEWDQSSLSFDHLESGFCARDTKGFFTEISNVGEGKMEGPTEFWIYYVQDGSEPNKNNPGTIIYKGVVNSLGSGDTTLLKYEPESAPTTGKYLFTVAQRPYHGIPNELKDNQSVSDGRLLTWSKSAIEVDQTMINECWQMEDDKQETAEKADSEEESAIENETQEDQIEPKVKDSENQEDEKKVLDESLPEEELEVPITEGKDEEPEVKEGTVEEEQDDVDLENEKNIEGDSNEVSKKDN